MTEKIYIGINDKRIEATGEALEQVLNHRAKHAELQRLLAIETEAKVAARESALAKLAALGLTADEIAAL
jgi:hypothetical protein